MKLKDLIGVIPRSEKLSINSRNPVRFDEVDWNLLNKEVKLIWADNSDWVEGVIGIAICD